MSRSIIFTIVLLVLPACDLIDPPDWREGEEPMAECVERLEGWHEAAGIAARPGALFAPTYTYDITKLGLEAIQDLTVEGSDEAAGWRGRAAANQTSTARDAFMDEPVDSSGAFFMGTDPALYRVRAPAQPLGEIVQAGCQRQQADMRLIDIEAAAMQTGSPVDDTFEGETTE